MNLLHDALRAGHAAPLARPSAARRVLVVGGAGTLGAAVLEQLLASRAFGQVSVLVTQPLNTALRGLVALPAAALNHRAVGTPEEVALIVFDRERHANGRDLAFLRPLPEQLGALAAGLHERGVRRLIVVVPHASASLPDALKRGLANLDEQAVAALGFEQLIFIRSAQALLSGGAPRVGQRVANWVLSQLRLMIPQQEQPVRALKLAQFVVQLAAHLHEAAPGTRIVPPELVWLAAQRRDVSSLARDWLLGRALPEASPARMRM